MTFARTLSAIALVAIVAAPVAVVAQDRAMQTAIEARQGIFQNYQNMVNVMGGMARGNIPYDAATAQAAADNLVALTELDARFNWPVGSDSDSVMGTRARPEIWENFDDVVAKAVALNESAVELQAVAGTGVEALGPAIGNLGAACTACHEAYRAEN
jgi:cytochrome c556